MAITIISCSSKTKSNSLKVAQFVESQLKTTLAEPDLQQISLEKNPIPLWDEGVWAGEESWKLVWQPFSETLKASDAFVFVVPEWGGMVPPGVKNFLLLCNAQELSHKPALIISVSAGRSGSYPISELRMSGYKNTQVCFLPEHVIVRNANEVLNSLENPQSKDDSDLRNRLNYALRLLVSYKMALKSVREIHQKEFSSFPFGM